MNESTDFSSPQEPPSEPTPELAWWKLAGCSSPAAGEGEGVQIPPAGAVPHEGEPPAGAVPPGSVPPEGGGYGSFGPPRWGPQRPAGRMRRRRSRPAAVVGLAAVAMAGSAVVAHELWPARSLSAAAIQSPARSPAPSSGSTSPFGFAFPGSGSSGSSGTSGGSTGTPSSSREGTGAPSNISAIAADIDPALVVIDTSFSYQQAEGAGTGIVLTANGEILTNNHVINGATSIKVTDMGNGRTYTADVVGYDASKDVAVLHLVGASGLKTASIATGAVKVGTAVVAVGNAGGTGTMTPAGGAVTALNRSITASDELDGVSENLVGLIETDADVQSGDSGGPLVNASGQVVGMDTAASQGYSLQSQYTSGRQGYAIPIAQALSIVNDIETGRSSATTHIGPTAFIGVLISSGNVGGQSYHGYGGAGAIANGAQVAGVVPGGAAASAGLTAGDVITGVGGQPVSSGTDLSQIVGGLRPGQTVPLTYTDTSGSGHSVSMTLQSGPPA